MSLYPAYRLDDVLDGLTPIQFFILLEQGMVRKAEEVILQNSMLRLAVASLLDEKGAKEFKKRMDDLARSAGLSSPGDDQKKILASVPIGRRKK